MAIDISLIHARSRKRDASPLARSAVAASVMVGLSVQMVHAQEASEQKPADTTQLEEVVVTAERREQNLQKTAASVAVRSGEELQQQGRYSLSQILEDISGVQSGGVNAVGQVGGTDASGADVTIRGIPSNTRAPSSITSIAPAAAIYVDGVYEGVGGSYDIDRVEVQRGPQGTLYGRSATSGLVAIHTADPELGGVGGDASLEFGKYELQHYTAAVNVPLSDDIALRVAGNRYEQDGYDSDAGGQRTTTDGRIKFLYKPDENLSVLLGAALQNNTTHVGGVTVYLDTPDSYRYDRTTPIGLGENRFRQYWGQLDWDLGPATLTWLPAYRTWESDSVTHITGALSVDQTSHIPKDHFHTEELRLASNPGSTLAWQVGALYFNNELSNQNTVTIVPIGALAFSSDTRSKSTDAIGVFGEVTYPFSDSWRVTGGVRYDHSKVAVDQAYTSATLVTKVLTGDEGTRRFNNVTWRARLEHDLTAQNLIYGSISTGATPGDLNVSTGNSGNPVVFDVKAETLTAFEIGSKNRFLDDSLQLNLAAFYYDYGAYQTVVSVVVGGVPTTQPTSSPARVGGGELEAIYQLTPADRIGLNLAYTNARFVDQSDAFAQFFARDEIPKVVPFTANLSLEHDFTLPGDSTLSLRGQARYRSAHDELEITQAQLGSGKYPFVRADDEVVGDVSATWTSSSSRYAVTGYVRNVGDNRYKTNLSFQTSGDLTAVPYDPLTVGIVLRAGF